MSDAPPRSRRDIVGQLAVILLLIAVLVGAVIVLDKFVTSHRAGSPPATSTPAYNYSCCTGWGTNTNVTPGETLHLDWYKSAVTPGDEHTATLTLTAFLSKHFASDAAIKSATKSGSFSIKSGPFSAAAGEIQLSNRAGTLPISSIRIPGNAKKGYYAIVVTSSQKDFAVSTILMVYVR
jgi:hypothetical protein